MAYLNFNYGLMVAEDSSDINPKVRMPDITKSIQGVVVGNDKSDRITLGPGESKDIVVTARALAWDASTQLQFDRYISSGDNMRIKWTGTGTNPGFRTARNIAGGATTAVSISRVSPYVARVSVISGTAWSLATVQVGDLLRFEKNTDSFTSPFSPTNLGKTFQVQAKGATYIDFVDNGEASQDANVTLGASFGFALRVMSTGPTKIGDTLELSGPTLNLSNAGKYTIVDVSSDYIEVVNPYGVNETVTYSSNSMNVYDYLIGFVHLRATGKFKMRFGGQAEWATVDRLGNEALFIASVSTYKIEAKNDGSDTITISVQHAMVA